MIQRTDPDKVFRVSDNFEIAGALAMRGDLAKLDAVYFVSTGPPAEEFG